MTRHLRHCRFELLRDTGRAPRTCARCGLGPCEEGHEAAPQVKSEIVQAVEQYADSVADQRPTLQVEAERFIPTPSQPETVRTRVEIPTVFIAAIVRGQAATILSAHYSYSGAADACFDSEDRNNAQVFTLEMKP